MPKSSCSMMCFLGTYAVGMTIAFLVAVVVCVVTTGTCQEIHNGRNASNFQEAQTRQTNIMVDFFSDVEAKGSELSKQEAGCQGKEQKLPPLLLGLHFLELVALGLLTMHCIFHCHTLGVYLQQSYCKMKQRQLEEEIKKAEEEKAKLNQQEWR